VSCRFYSLPAGILVLALLAAPNVDRADCGNLADRHAAAVAKVIDALRSYETCVASTIGHSAKRSDCATEMQALDDAHDDLVDSVADAKSCP
jgi:hypothetical protein